MEGPAARDVRGDLQVPVQITWEDDSRMALTENISAGVVRSDE
jgi:hypothetical protein